MFEGTAWERWISRMIERLVGLAYCRMGSHDRYVAEHRLIIDPDLGGDPLSDSFNDVEVNGRIIGDVAVYKCRRPGCEYLSEYRSERGSKPFRTI